MKKIVKYFNFLINFLLILFRYFISKRDTKNQKNFVYFDLNDIRLQPYYYAIIFHFHECNYGLYLKFNIKFIAASKKVGSYLYQLNKLKLTLFPPKKDYILITDRKGKTWNLFKGKKFFLDCNIFQSNKPNHWLQIPFPINPEFYHNGMYKEINSLRNEKGSVKVFFSGNQDASEYNHQIFKDFFNILSRNALISSLLENLNKENILIIDDYKSMEKVFQNEYTNKFVLIKWSWSPQKSSNLELRIKNSNWFSILSNCDFFLAAPGIRMPMCFNVIEAMSVGCVPIIEYSHFFNPKLVHLKNCITFENETDLVEKMNFVFEMKDSEIREMRKNVINYYDKYLAPGCICSSVEKNNVNHLYFYATEISYQKYLGSLNKL